MVKTPSPCSPRFVKAVLFTEIAIATIAIGLILALIVLPVGHTAGKTLLGIGGVLALASTGLVASVVFKAISHAVKEVWE